MLSPSIDNLVAQLTRLPGIGSRTAQRLAFHLLKASEADANALADAIREVKERIRPCSRCFNLAEEELCQICADPRRDGSLICVVEDPSDVVALERTHEYRGLYHVLGGALSPIDGVDPEHLRIAELLQRVEDGEVTEVPPNFITTVLFTALSGLRGLGRASPRRRTRGRRRPGGRRRGA